MAYIPVRPVPGASLYLEYASVRGTSVMVMALGGTSGGSMARRGVDGPVARSAETRATEACARWEVRVATRRDAPSSSPRKAKRHERSLDQDTPSESAKIDLSRKPRPRPRARGALQSVGRDGASRSVRGGSTRTVRACRARPPRPSFGLAWRPRPPTDPMAPVGTPPAPITCVSTLVAWRTSRR